MWNRRVNAFGKMPQYCLTYGCPNEECRVYKSQKYINAMLNVKTPDSKMFFYKDISAYWEAAKKNIQRKKYKYTRVSFHGSEQIVAVSNGQLIPRHPVQPMLQHDALVLLQEQIIRIDVKRVIPRPKGQYLAYPIAASENELELDVAVELAGCEYGVRTSEEMVAEVRHNLMGTETEVFQLAGV